MCRNRDPFVPPATPGVTIPARDAAADEPRSPVGSPAGRSSRTDIRFILSDVISG